MKRKIISIYDKAEIKTGAHKRYLGLLRELKTRGHSIILFSPSDLLGDSAIHFKIKKLQNRLPKTLQTLFSVRNKFKSLNIDISSYDLILIFGFSPVLAAIYLKKHLGVPIVYAVRSNIYEYRKIKLAPEENRGRSKTILKEIKSSIYLSAFSKIEYFVYRSVDHIVVQNDKDSNELATRYNLEVGKIHVIPNNLNFNKPTTPNFTNESNSLESVIFVGSLNRRKGIMLLLHAVKSLLEGGSNIKLNILGEGPLESDVIDFINKNDLNKYVFYRGYVNNPLEIIASSDLMVVPSIKDSFPNTVLEALYVGTPVIGSNTGGIEKILKDDSLLFEPDSVIAIANKLKELNKIDNYKSCRKKCVDIRSAFVFDWTGKFEKLLTEEI